MGQDNWIDKIVGMKTLESGIRSIDTYYLSRNTNNEQLEFDSVNHVVACCASD